MILKLLSAVYLAAAVIGTLVLSMPGNATKMLAHGEQFGTGRIAAIHGYFVLATLAVCGVTAWYRPELSPYIAWAVPLVAGVGHLLVAAIDGNGVCKRCLATGMCLQSIGALAITAAAS